MTVNKVPTRLYLKRIALGIAVVVLFVPALFLAMLAELGKWAQEEVL